MATIALTSCDTTQRAGTSDYATNGRTDGGYNPYPTDGNGVAQHGGSLLPSNSYGQRVPPPPTGYTPPPIPGSSGSSTRVASSSSTKKTTPTKSSTSGSSTARKSTASAASASSKPKPAPSSSPAKSTPKKPSSGGGGTHVVVQGDTLWGIARKNHTTVDKIKAINGLSSDKLKIGLKLKLP